MQKMRQVAVAFVAFMFCATPALAQTVIQCTARTHKPVVIVLEARVFNGVKLHFLQGSFVFDMTPCAPTDGYGLSAPTGTVGIVAITRRWQEVSDHIGGVTMNWTSPTRILFGGTFSKTAEWRFEVNRLTGTGNLTLRGKKPVSYKCALAKPKF
ncbi:MAG: hypothetical protein AB7F96_18885 [Beijerinckiaceae bacterium]